MQAGADFSPEEAADFRGHWEVARDNAVSSARALMKLGAHKQLANRILEPFMWIDTLITATDWKNFLALRDHKAAEPHFRDLAVLVRQAIGGADVQVLEEGQWHLPYINQKEDLEAIWGWLKPKTVPAPGVMIDYLKRISAARCARISYTPFDGRGDIGAELERYDLLMKDAPRHASPVEHQAQVAAKETSLGGREQWPNSNRQLRGNFAPGWIQFRKTIEGEAVHG